MLPRGVWRTCRQWWVGKTMRVVKKLYTACFSSSKGRWRSGSQRGSLQSEKNFNFFFFLTLLPPTLKCCPPCVILTFTTDAAIFTMWPCSKLHNFFSENDLLHSHHTAIHFYEKVGIQATARSSHKYGFIIGMNGAVAWLFSIRSAIFRAKAVQHLGGGDK